MKLNIGKTEVKAIFLSLLLSFFLGFASIELLGIYGWTVFVLIPIFLGFFPSYIARKSKSISKKEGIVLGFLALFLAIVGLLVFAIEGLICIAMSFPILCLLTYLGAIIANNITSKLDLKQTTSLVLMASLLSIGFDTVNQSKNLLEVKSSIVVNQPIDKVWGNVIEFGEISKPEGWIFKTGISYPTDAKIIGTGVGAIRYCNFSTGSFIEPITEWDEPRLLQFDVIQQPIPMNEFNPFWDISPPHLTGYFKSHKGQFKLEKISDNKTRVEGTTWYSIDISPQIYWKFWSDFIIHKIHHRVLNHIKLESEASFES